MYSRTRQAEWSENLKWLQSRARQCRSVCVSLCAESSLAVQDLSLIWVNSWPAPAALFRSFRAPSQYQRIACDQSKAIHPFIGEDPRQPRSRARIHSPSSSVELHLLSGTLGPEILHLFLFQPPSPLSSTPSPDLPLFTTLAIHRHHRLDIETPT
jgi:hypothetical protein